MLELRSSKGADVNATNDEFSPLIAPILCDCEQKYKIKRLELLLEKGADPNVILPMWGHNTVSRDLVYAFCVICGIFGTYKQNI